MLASTLQRMGPEKPVNIDAAVQVGLFLNVYICNACMAHCLHSKYSGLTGWLPA